MNLKDIRKIKKLFSSISVLKSIYYSIFFKQKLLVGKNTLFIIKNRSSIELRKPWTKIGVEYNSPIMRTVIEIKGDGKLIFEGKADIKKGVLLSVGDAGHFTIGNKSYINENCRIVINSRSSIGQGCAISWNVTIVDDDSHQLYGVNQTKNQSVKPLTIGNKVWVGCNSTILKGVTILDGSVIGAGTLITKDVGIKTLVCGNPQQIKRKNILWK